MHEVRPPRYGKSNACFNEAPTIGELVLTATVRPRSPASDGGQTSRMTSVTVQALAISPADEQVVYGLALPNNFPGSGSRFGITRSQEGGLTWEYRLSGSAFDAVAADSHDRDILYVGSRNGVFRSTDGGLTLEGWTNPAEPLMGVPTALAFDSDGRYAWLAADEASLYPCADGGRSWTYVGHVPTAGRQQWSLPEPYRHGGGFKRDLAFVEADSTDLVRAIV